LRRGRHAEVPERARQAFDDGRFVIAALCEAEGSAEAYAFAARARTADAIHGVTATSVSIALSTPNNRRRTAIERDPKLAEATFSLPIALGFRAASSVPWDAPVRRPRRRAARLSTKRSNSILQMSGRAPPLGGWNLENRAPRGSFLPRPLRAHEEEGLKYFEEALAADPAGLLMHFHFALSFGVGLRNISRSGSQSPG